MTKKKKLQQRRDKCARFKDLDNRLKALHEKQGVNSNITKMTRKSFKISVNEIYFEPPKKTYVTDKTDVYQVDDIWSLDKLDLKEYGPETNRNYR